MSTHTFHADTHRAVLVCFFFFFFIIILGACGTATTPADDTGTEADTGTEGDTIPFELVVEGVNDGVAYCGVKKPTIWPACGQEDLATLWTGDKDEFATLFADNIKLDPPAIDLDGKQAILSYLPGCGDDGDRLYMDRIASSGDTLLLEEILEKPKEGDAFAACPYFVVTIPDTVSFTNAEATLTEVFVDGNPWYSRR
ncbi:MAG: hypothetical protein GXP62_12650 [Oligoflexia bacterium]|nr:hypothetical protein [Oligoflexia bacterium]